MRDHVSGDSAGPAGNTILVTGGAGFFGDILVQRLLADGHTCVSLDLQPAVTEHPRLHSVQADIRDRKRLEQLFAEYRFSVVFHCAAMLAHAITDEQLLWSSNVEGTRVLAEVAAASGARKLVFISSNCLWAENFHRPVTEDDEPSPVEIYGRSKWEAERILQAQTDSIDVAILRTPTVVASGRLGLLTILFDFIREGKRVWAVGGGRNRYQFVYGPDLADACVRAAAREGSGLYNVGSDDVTTLREVYEYVIDRSGTTARVVAVPKAPAVAAMRIAAALKISPLGPYHWRMIAEDFVFDTSRAKSELGWQPTLTNEEMLAEAYKAYDAEYEEIQSRTRVSAHRQPAALKVIRLVKWLS